MAEQASEWRSVRGRKAEWVFSEVNALARAWLENLPHASKRLLYDEARWQGGAVVFIKDERSWQAMEGD
eukprot:495448-Alexandrium_andersonii.AAC.1